MDVVQDDSSDDLLIERARLGDSSARTFLLRSLQDRWFRFACTMLHDQELARDAAQETAVRVLQKLSTFDRRSRFSTWSIGITLNVCREIRRRRTAVTLDSVPERAAIPGDAPAELLERQESIERLRSAMAGLTERQREAVVLRFFEDRSVEETAELMNCAPGTVKATVHQAMAAMKAYFCVKS